MMQILIIKIVLLFLLVPSLAFGANSMVVDSITLTQTFESIGYIVEFTGDDNGDNTVTVEYSTDETNWTTVASGATTPASYIDRRAQVRSSGTLISNPYEDSVRGSIVGLTRGTLYYVRATFVDADGITGTNPISASVTTWSHDVPTLDVTCSDSVANDAALSAAITACSGSTGTLTLADGNYGAETITISGSGLAGMVKLVAANPQLAHFTGEVTLSGADYIVLEDFDFDAGINITGDTLYNVIKGNTFTGQGIRLTGDVTGLLVENNSAGSIDTNSGDQYDTFFYAKTAMSGGGVFRNNTLNIVHDGVGGEGNSPYNAGFDDWDFYGNEITRADDDFFEVEGGSVNTRIFNNILHIRGNTGLARGNGIAINPVVVGPIYIFNNLVYQARHGMKVGNEGGGGNTDGYAYILNNTFTTIDEYGVNQTNSPQENLYFKNNIFSQVGTYYYYEINSVDLGWVFDYNLYYDSGAPNWRYNAINSATWATWNATYDTNSLNVDPSLDGFYKPDSSGDPIVDTGITIAAMSFDLDSAARPQSTGYDIGAYEFLFSGPVRSGASPSSNVAYTTTATISLSTAAAATCKYDSSSGVAYANMSNTFGTTGSTSHSDTGVSVSVGSNTFYVRCTDGVDANITDYPITFTVLASTQSTITIGGSGAVTIGGSGTITIN